MLIAAAPLVSFRGGKRVVVVFAPVDGSPSLVAQDAGLAGDPAGSKDRDLAIVHVVGDRVDGAADTAMSLRARFGVARGDFAVRLIGKDGHVALRSAAPIDSMHLFGAIDAMPMRRDEMAHRRD